MFKLIHNTLYHLHLRLPFTTIKKIINTSGTTFYQSAIDKIEYKKNFDAINSIIKNK